MRPFVTATLAATLGAGCGAAPPSEATPPTEQSAALGHGHAGHDHAGHHGGHGHAGHHGGHNHAGHHGDHSHAGPGGHRHAHGPGAHQHAFTDAEAWTQVFDDPARDEWQRPDDVLRALALTPSMVVADVGAGTGYFSTRIARAVPQGEVLATDFEPDMVRFLKARAERETLPNLRAIQATERDSGLTAQSVDRVLIVNVWHHIDGREAYARHLAQTLKPGGRVLIVDFKVEAHRGPPPQFRLAPEEVIAAFESVGLTAKVLPVDLPDQYIVEASAAP